MSEQRYNYLQNGTLTLSKDENGPYVWRQTSGGTWAFVWDPIGGTKTALDVRLDAVSAAAVLRQLDDEVDDLTVLERMRALVSATRAELLGKIEAAKVAKRAGDEELDRLESALADLEVG